MHLKELNVLIETCVCHAQMKDGSQVGTNVKDPLKVGEPALPNRDLVV